MQVEVDITKPIPIGFFHTIRKGKLWIQFCYARLGDLCYNCGLLGHLKNVCLTKNLVSSDENGEVYEAWLRVEVGAFSMVSKGSFLRRVENRRNDFFDSFTNEELEADVECSRKLHHSMKFPAPLRVPSATRTHMHQ